MDVATADPVAGTDLLYTLHFYACPHKASPREMARAALAPVDGPWTDAHLTNDAAGIPIAGGVKGGGHGQLVANWMRQ